MVLIKWRESYSVGVEQFDKEHKVLVDLINDIYIIVRNHIRDTPWSIEDQTVLEKDIADLVEYTQAHFRSEEEAMRKSAFPLLEEHKNIHAELEEEVLVFKERVKEGKEGIVSDLYLFLRDWLINHILEEDMKYK